MDLVNIGRSRRFLRERPIRVNLFDRPRLVCDLLCLEAEQTEKRRGLATSDSLYVVIEGKARLQSGPQIEEMQEQDAALIPPGVDHTIENLGPGRLTVMVLVTPKPSRAGEVRMPAEGRPRERVFQDEATEAPSRYPRRAREDEPPRAPPRPRRGFDGPPPRQRPAPRTAAPRGRREGGETEGPVWYPRPKPAWQPRGRPPVAAARGGPGRPAGPPRGRGGPPAGAGGRTEGTRGASGPAAGARGRPEGTRGAGGRPAGARGRPEGPRGEPPAGPRGRSTGPRGGTSGGYRGRAEGARGEAPAGTRGRSTGPGGSTAGGGYRGRAEGARDGASRARGGPGPTQPDRRGGSRGRPPPRQSGRPAPGRSAPRTSAPRQSRES